MRREVGEEMKREVKGKSEREGKERMLSIKP